MTDKVHRDTITRVGTSSHSMESVRPFLSIPALIPRGLGLTFAATLLALACDAANLSAQDYERYRPRPLAADPVVPDLQTEPLPPVEGTDRVLVPSLNAILVLDSKDKVEADNAFESLSGIQHNFDATDSLVYGQKFAEIVHRYLGGPVTLRQLNQMSRDIILMYRDAGQPVVDVFVPEQRITAGTVQLVVVESRIDRVLIQEGCFFDAKRLDRWIQCTRPGSRIYESSISNDLFWLNQNAFRRVDVDLQPGSTEGTSDVVFQVKDVRPINAYVGYEDTGVRTLELERIYGGVIWGNALNRGGTLSYQYTADTDFRFLHAHAVSYLEPLSRDWTFQTYGSWAGVNPAVLQGLIQSGESWQTGVGLIRTLKKTPTEDISVSVGFDFKQTNNNLEFGGIRVSDTGADLAQLRVGFRKLWRCPDRDYSIFELDGFIGPGGGFSSDANTAAMNTIRPGTRPDYFYGRLRYERMVSLPYNLELVGRAKGQVSTERLLFSETLGFGGYDSIRGYDQRTYSADSGWITSLELGPSWKWGCDRKEQRLRVYGFTDAGGAYIKDALPTDLGEEFMVSVGAGMRYSLGTRTSLRVDYGYGFQDVPFAFTTDRVHIGFVTLFGPRPE